MTGISAVAPKAIDDENFNFYGKALNGPSGSSTVSGATSNCVTVANAQPADSGGYLVVISNTYGATTSAIVLVNISSGCTPPNITGPANQTVIQGNNATFSASVAAN